MMEKNLTWIDNAKYLMDEGGILPSMSTGLACGYEMENGVLILSVDGLHYPTYYLSNSNGEITVIYKQLDNYKKHDKANHITYEMDDDEWDELTCALDELVNELESYKKLKNTNLKPLIADVLAALFDDPRLGKRPTEDYINNLSDTTIIRLLDEKQRVAGWEWKNWGDQCFLLAELPAMQAVGGFNSMPTDAEITAAFKGDLCDYTLNWLDKQLAPHGFTVLALGLVNEYQDFCLISVNSVKVLKKSLKKLVIKYQLAKKYS